MIEIENPTLECLSAIEMAGLVHSIGCAAVDADAIVEEFGQSGAVRATFIPQMLRAVMYDQARMAAAYAKRHRVKEVRKQMRVIETAAGEYHERLREAYGDAVFGAYMRYQLEYSAEAGPDICKMQIHAEVAARSARPSSPHHELAARLLIAETIAACVERLEAETAGRISALARKALPAMKDCYMEAVTLMCSSVREEMFPGIETGKYMGMWMNVLENRASSLADRILRSEREAYGIPAETV